MELRHEPDRSRFVVEVDGAVVAHAAYRRHDGRYVIEHTEVDDVAEGRGIGSILAGFALDSIRADDQQVVPLCPFIAGDIDRHDEYADLVDVDLTAELRGR